MKQEKAAAVILAAGSGHRFGGDVPKQHCLLGTRSVLYYTLRAFDRTDEIGLIQLVVRAEDVAYTQQLVPLFSTPIHICVGGDDRQASSRLGVAALPADISIVAIHDAARCLVTPSLISQTVCTARQCGAAMAASTVVDTVKRVSSDGCVTETVARETLCLAQTPQTMRRAWYETAAAEAERSGLRVTDDVALLQACGMPVHAVFHTSLNPKITYTEDLTLAEYELTRRGDLV